MARAIGIEPIANSLSPVESVGLTLLEERIWAGKMGILRPSCAQIFPSPKNLADGIDAKSRSVLGAIPGCESLRRNPPLKCYANSRAKSNSTREVSRLQLLRAELPPRHGRPHLKHIRLAVAMRERGESWRMVMSLAFPVTPTPVCAGLRIEGTRLDQLEGSALE